MNAEIEHWGVATLTYNVNKQRPSKENVQAWLNSESLAVDDAKIVCVAMQEIPHAEMFKTTAAQNSWSEQITPWMAERGLTLANKLTLASNMLLLYISLDILNLTEHIENRWCRSTMFGAFGYKGTISTKLKFRFGAVLVFVTSHFYADEKYHQERVKQYHKSLECTFPEEKTPKKYIIWQGDMNSRVEGFENSTQFIAKLDGISQDGEEGALQKLVEEHDQLTKSRRRHEAFVGYREAEIAFKPSYRILVGSGLYDTLRIPSWCDRILFRGDADHLSLLNYSSCRSITTSDHFPVSARFSLKTQIEPSSLRGQWPCSVQHICTWEEFIPLVCRVQIPEDLWNKECSATDWIGVFPAPVDSVSRPLSWVYTFTCPFDDQRNLVAEFQPLSCAVYRVGYFCCRRNCLVALSNQFRVRKVEDR